MLVNTGGRQNLPEEESSHRSTTSMPGTSTRTTSSTPAPGVLMKSVFSVSILIPHRDVLGNWKMAGKSRDTLTRRNDRATSPLISRGLDR